MFDFSLIVETFSFQLTVFSLFLFLIGLVILWVIVSIPVYVAAKALIGSQATLGSAMLATLLGPIVYYIVFLFSSVILGLTFGFTSTLLAAIFAFIAWLWVYKSVFHTGWIKAFGITILAIIVLFLIMIILPMFVSVIMPVGISYFF